VRSKIKEFFFHEGAEIFQNHHSKHEKASQLKKKCKP
jgi:hypothetical protein